MDRLRADATTALQNITQADAQLHKCLGALHANLDHVAMQVRTNLARQADSLRMREAWLLKQLELVHADKTEVLTRQRDRLAQAAESLRTCLQNANCSENQLVDCLDSLSSVNLMPEETPFISYRVDSALLREMISQYGRVVPGYSGHFAEPGRPSACLPRPFEEEDEEGSGMQMAHKPLQSGVRIPQFGHGRAFVRAWLSHQAQQQQQQQQTKAGVPSSCASKTDCGDSFEILSPFGVSPNFAPPIEGRDDWVSRERPSAVVEKSTVHSIFDDVTKQPNELWLRPGRASVTVPKAAAKFEPWPSGEAVSLGDDGGDGELSDAVVDMEKDVDHAAIVAGVCAAPLAGGDPCKSFDQCCCEDSCLERLLERPVAAGGKVDRMLSEWLLTKEGGGGMRLKEEKMEEDAGEEEEDDDERQGRNADSVEFWLQRCQPTVNSSSPSITSHNFKLQLLDGEISKWLHRPADCDSCAPAPQRSAHGPEASYEQWLCSHMKRKMDVQESGGSHPEDVKWLQ